VTDLSENEKGPLDKKKKKKGEGFCLRSKSPRELTCENSGVYKGCCGGGEGGGDWKTHTGVDQRGRLAGLPKGQK